MRIRKEKTSFTTLFGGLEARTVLKRGVSVLGGFQWAARLAMSDKAAKRNLGYLREKLAVDVLRTGDAATRTATTYRVYSFKAILERRRAAGLQFVVKDKGVRFVPCPPGLSLSSTKDDESPNDKTAIVDITSIGATDKTSIDPMDKNIPRYWGQNVHTFRQAS